VGEQYDRNMSDLLAIQPRDCERNCRETEAKIWAKRKGAAKHYTESNRGLSALFERRFSTEQADGRRLKKSIEYQSATDKDPRFALAYAGLADSYVVPANRLPPREAMPKAKAASDPGTGTGRDARRSTVSLGRVFAVYDWDWTSAEKESSVPSS